MNELCGLSARAAVAALRKGEVSPLELVDAAAERIAETDGALNAMPTLCLERARGRARALAESPPDDPPPHWLAGLPIAVKDLEEVEGVRTTFGSPIHADHVSERSDFTVERLEENGAVVVGKSNTPEFGAGSQTFNEVFGATGNPWRTDLTPGGSSGGSAAALAAGQVWLATGSDLGGSLRNPASFCGVVGIRPGPGRVAHGPLDLPFGDLAVHGPMARNVGDAALMLDAMAGLRAGDPLSREAPETPYARAAAEPETPARVAFSADLGGIAPVDPQVRDAVRAAAARFSDMGATVEETCFDLAEAQRCFHVLRALGFAASHGALLAERRRELKWEVAWNIEAGRALQVEDIVAARRVRGEIFHRAVTFFESWDLLLCPAAAVPPFPKTTRWPDRIDGAPLRDYIDWLLVCSAVTLTSCPALSVPGALTADGRPVGVQMVAPPRREDSLIRAAAAFEQTHDFAAMVPRDPAPPPA